MRSASKYHNYRLEELSPSNWKVFFANKSELRRWQWWYYRVRRVRRVRYGNITVARAGSSPELEEYEIQIHLQPLISSSLLLLTLNITSRFQLLLRENKAEILWTEFEALFQVEITNFPYILFANLRKFSWQEKLQSVKDTN